MSNLTRVTEYDVSRANNNLRVRVDELKKNLNDTSKCISRIGSIPQIKISYQKVEYPLNVFADKISVSSYQNLEELKSLIRSINRYSRSLTDNEINTELDDLESKIKNYNQNKRPTIYNQLKKTIECLDDVIEKLNKQEGSESINNLKFYVATTKKNLETLQTNISNFNRKLESAKIQRVQFNRQ